MGQFLSLLHWQVEQPSKRQSTVDNLSDKEIYDLIEAARKNHDNALGQEDIMFLEPPHPDSVVAWRITHDAVAKESFAPTETFIMSYVSSRTSISMPRVRRVLPRFNRYGGLQGSQWIIMDYVEGKTLKHGWDTMSWWARLRVIWYMRSYIRQLHRLPLPSPDVPGPFDDSGTAYECEAYYFTQSGGGPFRSYGEMADWFDRRRFDALVAEHRQSGIVHNGWPKFDRSQPLVLCHMDLHMNNIIVDPSGIPWIIDWGYAGAFLAWLEYATITVRFQSPKLWLRSARFMVGDYEKYVTDYIDRMEDLFEENVVDEPLDYFTKLGVDVD